MHNRVKHPDRDVSTVYGQKYHVDVNASRHSAMINMVNVRYHPIICVSVPHLKIHGGIAHQVKIVHGMLILHDWKIAQRGMSSHLVFGIYTVVRKFVVMSIIHIPPRVLFLLRCQQWKKRLLLLTMMMNSK